MGVFENNAGQGNDQKTANTGDQSLEDLVGEGKKYATNEDALGSIPAKEAHISQIENENKQLREDALKHQTMQEQLAEFQKSNSQSNSGDEGTQTGDKNLTLEDVQSVINDTREKDKQNDNAAKSLQAAVDAFGDKAKANEAVGKRADELGMTLDQVNQLAATSPAAFKRVMGLSTQETHQQTTTSDFNTQGFGNTEDNSKNPNHEDYWKALRKSDFKQWSKRAKEKMDIAVKQGDKFFS